MSKNIIFCADGTWNGPDQDDNNDNIPDPTNVYKLFQSLGGALRVDVDDEKEKELIEGGVTTQVAKYLHGVGDSENPLVRMMGGIFGSGIITRIVRGYTFISREYEEGDDIFILGFSRGAYTARALAGFIAKQGLLSKELTRDKEIAYEKGSEAWYRYREGSSHKGILQRLAEIAPHLPAFFKSDTLKDKDFCQVDHIKAVAVWDTVGALGLPDFECQKRVDDFGFADTILNGKVEWGFHAISLDEERIDFTPTLWDKRDKVKQLLFPGAHSDVGGGYPTANDESRLSDCALNWMWDELEALKVRFVSRPAYDIRTGPAGKAHEPWGGKPYKTAKRQFPDDLIGHCSIGVRAGQAKVCPNPGTAEVKYQPTNCPSVICSGGAEKICAYCVKG